MSRFSAVGVLAFHIQRFECTQVHVQAGSKTRCGDKKISVTVDWLEVVAIWKIGQKLWTRDYGGVHEAIRGFDWSDEVQCLVAAFSGLMDR
ncbi:hypothetical protein RGQ29_005985 [Quercus rubra]|uniref:CSN8/PSMD8/EIF3K domain-containing protein n=1 Tax=Quercus rubra TaxID=3512 RepID=A0AAN7E5P2_QUERU|nr:hypothetical protein RGQ29_005985 [Quercus rubra]